MTYKEAFSLFPSLGTAFRQICEDLDRHRDQDWTKRIPDELWGMDLATADEFLSMLLSAEEGWFAQFVEGLEGVEEQVEEYFGRDGLAETTAVLNVFTDLGRKKLGR